MLVDACAVAVIMVSVGSCRGSVFAKAGETRAKVISAVKRVFIREAPGNRYDKSFFTLLYLKFFGMSKS
jgi:hypothetical protein